MYKAACFKLDWNKLLFTGNSCILYKSYDISYVIKVLTCLGFTRKRTFLKETGPFFSYLL